MIMKYQIFNGGFVAFTQYDRASESSRAYTVSFAGGIPDIVPHDYGTSTVLYLFGLNYDESRMIYRVIEEPGMPSQYYSAPSEGGVVSLIDDPGNESVIKNLFVVGNNRLAFQTREETSSR